VQMRDDLVCRFA